MKPERELTFFVARKNIRKQIYVTNYYKMKKHRYETHEKCYCCIILDRMQRNEKTKKYL